MCEHPGREKVGAGLRVSSRIFKRDPSGDLDHAVGANPARDLHAIRRSFRCHVVEQHGLRSGPEGLKQFILIAKDRKSTRLNSSHGYISYAVFCLKKKKIEA